MPGTKIQLFINAPRYGWQEVWFSGAPMPNSAVLPQEAAAVCTARQDFLSGQCTIVAVRYSDIDNPRQSLVYHIGRKGFGSSTTTPNDNELSPVAALFQLFASAGNFRRPYLVRGLPDFQLGITDQGTPDIGNVYNKVKFYIDVLNLSGWGMRYLNAGRAGQVGAKVVTALAAELVTNYFLLTVPTHGFSQGQIVNVHGFRLGDLGRLNGIHKVGVVDANTIKVGVRVANTPPTAYVGGASVAAIGYQLSAFKNQFTDFVGLTTRQTGRPFGLHRGRRRASR